MTDLHKISLNRNCFAFVIAAIGMLLTLKSEARYMHKGEIYSTLTSDTIPGLKKDSITGKVNTDSTAFSDSIPGRQRIDTFSLKYSKDTLDAPVTYEAIDSGVLLVKEKKFLLYGRTKTTYKDVIMTAPKVELDQETNILTAVNVKDSAGNIIARAKFEQGAEGFQSDTIRYNFKTQKGLTKNTYTKPQGDLFVQANLIKKVNNTTTFAKRVIMTTCDYDDPHFSFVANKGKFIANKIAITGPVHPEFEGVPLPIYLPFGLFPLKQGRHSGLLFSNIDVNEQWGIGLIGLGYYQVLNENIDAKLSANVYSYGGWSVQAASQYIKKYQYTGSVSLNIQHTKTNFKGDPDFQVRKAFQVNWSHASNLRARGRNFQASVSAGSSRYNELLPSDPYRNFQNQLASSINYSKSWAGKPYNLTLSANHSQNNLTRDVRVTLPDAAFSVTTIKPFAEKDAVGTPKWYREIGISYTGTARNQVAFYDTAKNTLKKLLDTMQWGAQHSFPISINIPQNSNIKFSPFVSYAETWLTKRVKREWDESTKSIVTTYDRKGLFIDRTASFGFSINTALFGTKYFKKSKKFIAIRHVIRPSASISYKPNMSKKFYDVIRTDSMTQRKSILTQFVPGENLYSGYGYGKFGGINFGIDNNLELKMRSKKDTGAAAIKKIRLIDGFEIRSGYNFLEDSLKLLPFTLALRMTLFQKVSITASGTLDPYQQDSFGTRINKLTWQGDHFSIGRLNGGSISMSTSFQSKPRDPSKSQTQTPRTTQTYDPNMQAEREKLQEYIRRNPAEFVDFNIPWTISFSFSMVFLPEREFNRTVRTRVISYTSFNNSFSLTPKWNFSTSGNFDFNLKELTTFTMSVSRDMHCWQMSLNVIPIGNFRSFNISINPKSSILQDLKVNRTRTFSKF